MSPPDRRQKHLLDLERVLGEIEGFAAGRTEAELLTDRAL